MLSSLGLVNPKIELNHFRLNINWHRLCKINMKSNLFSLKLFCTQKKRKTIVSDLTQSIQLTMTYLANSSVTTIIPEKLKRNSRTEIFSTIFKLCIFPGRVTTMSNRVRLISKADSHSGNPADV